jgi:23S rRNA pseudouridine1911/1915/1917 synthase
LYGRRLVLPRAASAGLIDILRGFKRQALHAGRLKLVHPLSLKPIEFTTPWPADFEQLLSALRQDARAPRVDPRNF